MSSKTDRTYLFVTVGQNGFIKPDLQCLASNMEQARIMFELAGERLCMNTAILCLGDIPEAQSRNPEEATISGASFCKLLTSGTEAQPATDEESAIRITAFPDVLEGIKALPYPSQVWLFGQMAEAINDGRLDTLSDLTPDYRERLRQALAILTPNT